MVSVSVYLIELIPTNGLVFFSSRLIIFQGAGKSTLLAALSGTTPKGARKEVSGSVWIDYLQGDADHIEISKSFLSMKDGQIAFLLQNDSFFSMLTPRETLNLATYLQLGINKSQRDILVDRTLDKLGLRHVESRRIGNPTLGSSGNISSGSLSGGERRRLSVGRVIHMA